MWIFAIVIVATYNGNLVATLSAPRTVPRVPDLNTLIHRLGIGIGVLKDSAIHDIIRYSPEPQWQEVADGLKDEYLFGPVAIHGFEKIHKDTDAAVIVSDQYYETFDVNPLKPEHLRRCQFVPSTEKILKMLNGFAFQKRSLLESIFTLE